MKKRIKWLDFAKGITIFFVLYGHSLSTIYDTKNINPLFFVTLSSIIFTFIMPCFFAISGYLYKPINNIYTYKKMIYKKLINLGIPYLLFSIVYVIMQNFGSSNVNHHVGYQALLKIYESPISYLWFIYALFFMFLIVGILDLIHINMYIQLIIYLFFTIITFIFPNTLWTGLQCTFNNILFFYIGYIVSKNNLNKILKNRKWTAILTMIFILLLIIQSFYVTGISNNNTNFVNIFAKIISILLLFNLSNVLPKNKSYNYFTKYGKFTLIIYLVHAPIMSILRVISFKLISINNISSILLSIFLVIVVWIISIFSCHLSQKYNFVNYIFYPLYKLKNNRL